MSHLPQISIIIPIYNVEKYLRRCMDSVVNQTFKDIEIICINDGSTDNSLKIISEYAGSDDRIKIINQKNQGLSQARNVGIKNAAGQYIMFLDSDDWIDVETCAEAYDLIEKNNADLVLWSYIREFDNIAKKKKIMDMSTMVFDEKEVKDKIYRRCVGLYKEELRFPENTDSIITAWGKLYRLRVIKENNIEFTDTKIIGTEDALFNIEVLYYIKRAVYIDKYFSHYRKNNDKSLTTTYKENLYIQWQEMYNRIYKILTDRNSDSIYFEALNNRIALSIIGLGLNILKSPKEKLSKLSNILNDNRYKTAYKHLAIQYMPIHWKVFYGCARCGFTLGVYVLLQCIEGIVGKS